ncbi:MAG: hypothetical protein AAGI38_21990, partial [Bacteroidota bacterium]
NHIEAINWLTVSGGFLLLAALATFLMPSKNNRQVLQSSSNREGVINREKNISTSIDTERLKGSLPRQESLDRQKTSKRQEVVNRDEIINQN